MNFDTSCLHAGYRPENGQPRNIPIIQSTTFRYESSQEMGKLFDLEASGYFYTRLQNPTSDAVAARLCALEGGSAAMLLSSGQAASFFSVFNLAGAGDHVVSSSAIYGGTYNLFAVTMKRMGIDFTFVDPDCSDEELEAAFRPNTKALFGETISNPALTVLDIERFAAAAHRHGDQQGVLVAIGAHLHDTLGLAAGGALAPELAARARPVRRPPGVDRAGQSPVARLADFDIAAGAGMSIGGTDCAAALLGLNELWNLKLPLTTPRTGTP